MSTPSPAALPVARDRGTATLRMFGRTPSGQEFCIVHDSANPSVCMVKWTAVKFYDGSQVGPIDICLRTRQYGDAFEFLTRGKPLPWEWMAHVESSHIEGGST